VRKSHLDLLALAPRLLEGFRIGQRTDTIPHVFVEVRVSLRTIAVVHFGFNEQREQSLLLAL
jgi:hypothetical protein